MDIEQEHTQQLVLYTYFTFYLEMSDEEEKMRKTRKLVITFMKLTSFFVIIKKNCYGYLKI